MNPDDELAAALAAGAADAQRAKLHFIGTIVSHNPDTVPKTVTVILDGGTVEIPDVPYHASYGAGVAPTNGEVVRVEAVGTSLVVLDRLA